MGAVYEATIVGLRVAHAGDEREQLRQQLSAALDRFTREAGFATNVDYAQDAQFQFDSPSLTNANYTYSGGTLTRADSGSSSITVLSNITAFDFNYIDDLAAEYASCDVTSSCASNCCRADVRAVKVTITVAKGNETLSMTSSASLRGL